MNRKTSALDPTKCAEIAETCACFNFRKASRSVTQLFDQTLAPTDLRSTQLVILIATYLLSPCSTARLARELVMDRSTLTRNLRPLMAQRLLTFVKATRVKTKSVALTRRGEEALLKAIPFWERAQSRLVNRMGKDRWKQVTRDLNHIVDATRSTS